MASSLRMHRRHLNDSLENLDRDHAPHPFILLLRINNIQNTASGSTPTSSLADTTPDEPFAKENHIASRITRAFWQKGYGTPSTYVAEGRSQTRLCLVI